MMGDQVSHP